MMRSRGALKAHKCARIAASPIRAFGEAHRHARSSPPLLATEGSRGCPWSRSSDSRIFLLTHAFPALRLMPCRAPVASCGLSSPLTAAGPYRIFTGFPPNLQGCRWAPSRKKCGLAVLHEYEPGNKYRAGTRCKTNFRIGASGRVDILLKQGERLKDKGAISQRRNGESD